MYTSWVIRKLSQIDKISRNPHLQSNLQTKQLKEREVHGFYAESDIIQRFGWTVRPFNVFYRKCI